MAKFKARLQTPQEIEAEMKQQDLADRIANKLNKHYSEKLVPKYGDVLKFNKEEK